MIGLFDNLLELIGRYLLAQGTVQGRPGTMAVENVSLVSADMTEMKVSGSMEHEPDNEPEENELLDFG